MTGKHLFTDKNDRVHSGLTPYQHSDVISW